MIWLPRLSDKSIPISVYAGDASNWERCAVGEFPHDKRLLVWGTKFANAVESKLGGGCDH